MRKGAVIGKFCPPHRGHKFLIDTALQRVDHLAVIVCNHPDQPIPGELRAKWLKEIHPDAYVVVTPDDLPDDDSVAWAQRTLHILGEKPDVVFTSEDYGQPWSKAIGCEHVQVDRQRVNVPISATQVREQPLKYLEFLEPCVRAYYIPRITLVGAESTGKTTLAQLLAKHFDCEWVAEYGREYSESKAGEGAAPSAPKNDSYGDDEASPSQADFPDYGPWTTDEFLHIATEQKRRENEAARRAEKLIICDTDAFATSIWHERYMGFASEAVRDIGREECNRIYLVPDPSMPFVQDGLRDGEAIREWMHKRFIEELTADSFPFHILMGTYKERESQAIETVLRYIVQ